MSKRYYFDWLTVLTSPALETLQPLETADTMKYRF